ncbi:uncharacterized protein B0T15DRAFT_72646 [Chaetomium strumarium]|uniref:Aminoglycoside phosphotransferase domain-containing protein n=1 Tax=Chaetomium strumarium TaxID=1170767 RepID=A0AAJ0H4G1_9PEZI|nr:hypothetical protein B0T15DRAFT_72646 [Chaetomium strumarium]
MQAVKPRVPDLKGLFALGDVCTELTTYVVPLFDCDARRYIKVTLPNPHGFDDEPDEERDRFVPGEKAAAALEKKLDTLPDGNLAVEIDEAGKLLSVSTDIKHYEFGRQLYHRLAQYQLPPAVAARTVLRSELTEIRRSAVDIVAYPPSLSPPSGEDSKNRYAFKYSTRGLPWKELQVAARLAPHPNMALLDRLVLDERGGSRVVGFTMRYIPSDSLGKARGRFKLKWLRQLMQAVDDLNLKHGIMHQDIADRNLLVDPETDAIVLIDFGEAYRIGMKGKWGERDDVKGVLVFLYAYITRDPALQFYILHEVDEKECFNPAKWCKHPDVELDDDVAEFYFELMTWVRGRRAGKQITRYTQAPEYFDWPPPPPEPHPDDWDNEEYRLEWLRPRSSKLDPTRRLLATGRYADDEAAAEKAAAAASRSETADMAKANGGRRTPSPPAGPPLTAADEAETKPERSSSGRTLRPRQANPSKRKHANDGADTEVGTPARKRRSSRRSSPALAGNGCA